jgi:DNA-binding NarL/FixJ family response regulator
MQNAIGSVNEGADGYILKPVDAQVTLDAVEKHLQKRSEKTKYIEKKVIEYIETRAREISFAHELGWNRTGGKIVARKEFHPAIVWGSLQ